MQKELGATGSLSGTATNLVASAVVSLIRVVVTNPLSRLEVIMQTNSLKGKSIGAVAAVKELGADMAKFGLSGIFRGQGIGIAKATVSLTLFHEGRIYLTNRFAAYNPGSSTERVCPPPSPRLPLSRRPPRPACVLRIVGRRSSAACRDRVFRHSTQGATSVGKKRRNAVLLYASARSWAPKAELAL